MPAGGEVNGRAHGGHGIRVACGQLAHFARPAQEGVSTQRNPRRHQWPRMRRAQALQHPADLRVVARMVGAGRTVDLAAAATEMGQGAGPALLARPIGKRLAVMAAR